MPSRDIALCVPELQEKWPLIKADYESAYPDRVIKPICTSRSSAEQQEAYAMGRTKPGKKITWIDGVTKIGAHNPIPGGEQRSRAIDVGVFIDGKYMTSVAYYKPLKSLADKYGLKSGWDFPKHACDPPHIEVMRGAVVEVKT